MNVNKYCNSEIAVVTGFVPIIRVLVIPMRCSTMTKFLEDGCDDWRWILYLIASIIVRFALGSRIRLTCVQLDNGIGCYCADFSPVCTPRPTCSVDLF